jgi:hypothetical protein
MNKKLYSILFFLFTISLLNVQGQVADNKLDDPGDIAFTSFSTYFSTTPNNPQGFAFVLLDNAVPGASIRFIDEEWNGTAFASELGEGEVLWTNSTGAIIPPGTVIIMTGFIVGDAPGAGSWITATVNLGKVDLADSGFTVTQGSGMADQIYAVEGTTTKANPKFIAFVGGSADMGTIMGTGLKYNETANDRLSARRNYAGSSDCMNNLKNCAKMINDTSVWKNPWSTTVSFPANVIDKFTNMGTTPTKELSTKNYSVFPNPSAGVFEISGPTSDLSNIVIVNTLGMKYISQVINGRFDITGVPPGIYFIKSEIEGLNSIKIIKQ